MTIDWFVALTPVVLLLVALPVLFVGCTRFTSGPGDPPAPDPEPAPPPGPPPDPPPVPPPVLTSFRLEMDPNLQVTLTTNPVVRIVVQWALESSTGGPAPLLVPQPARVITARTPPPPPNPPAIDPVTDVGAKGDVPSDDIGTRDTVRCTCTVFLADGSTPSVAGTQRREILQKDRTHEFRIQSRGPNLPGFRVYVNGA